LFLFGLDRDWTARKKKDVQLKEHERPAFQLLPGSSYRSVTSTSRLMNAFLPPTAVIKMVVD
jgi:hypothetical protein